MSHTCKHHGDTVFVGGLDHLFVAHGAAGLDDGGYTHFGGGVEAVAKREEGIGGHHRVLYGEAGVLGLDGGDAGAVGAAHLSPAW